MLRAVLAFALLLGILLSVSILSLLIAPDQIIEFESPIYWLGPDEIGSVSTEHNDLSRVKLPRTDSRIRLHTVPGTQIIFWCACSTGKIFKTDRSGSSFQEIISVPLGRDEGSTIRFRDFAIDTAREKFYWIEDIVSATRTLGRTVIMRANFDGTGIESPFPEIRDAMAIDVESETGALYLIERNPNVGIITRINFDASAREILIEGRTGTKLEIDQANEMMYWSVHTAIFRSKLDGSNVELFIHAGGERETPSQGSIPSFTIDSINSKIYWMESPSSGLESDFYERRLEFNDERVVLFKTQAVVFDLTILDSTNELVWGIPRGIESVNLETAKRESILLAFNRVESLEVVPQMNKAYLIDGQLIEIDLETSEMSWDIHLGAPATDILYAEEINALYWLDGGELIRRVFLDTLKRETVLRFDAGRQRVESLARDVDAGKLYWTSDGNIYRSNEDGSDIEHIREDPQEGESTRISLDVGNGKIYWRDDRGDRIGRANLDGSDSEILIENLNAQGFAIDLRGDKLYWQVYDLEKGPLIQRANLDGSDIEDVFLNTRATDIVIPDN
jgi:hypothetical protein